MPLPATTVLLGLEKPLLDSATLVDGAAVQVCRSLDTVAERTKPGHCRSAQASLHCGSVG